VNKIQGIEALRKLDMSEGDIVFYDSTSGLGADDIAQMQAEGHLQHVYFILVANVDGLRHLPLGRPKIDR